MADDSLFRIELILKSRHLGEVLAFLTGKAVQVSPPQVVVNAERRNGKLQMISHGRMVELFALWLKDRKLTKAQLRATNIREFILSVGLSPNSYSHYLRSLVDQGYLRKKGEGTATTYTANEAKVLKLAATVVPLEKSEVETHG